jgi:uncharacterized protein
MSTSELAIDRLAPTRRPVDQRVVMYQSWRSLLFLHWAFRPEEIRPLLPAGLGLELDTFGGQAYVGLVPFMMQGVRPKGLPAVPWLSNFHETNVRTYVHRNGRDPGVWFFSLEAANPIAVALARAWFSLPYYYARMRLDSRLVVDDRGRLGGPIAYSSERRTRRPVSATNRIDARVLPEEPHAAVVGTLEHFLLERYLLYAVRGGHLYSGQVHHTSYPVQAAEVDAFEESMLATIGLSRPEKWPLVHFARGVDVEIFRLRRTAASECLSA